MLYCRLGLWKLFITYSDFCELAYFSFLHEFLDVLELWQVCFNDFDCFVFDEGLFCQ